MRNRCFRFAAVAIGAFMVPALMAAPAAGQSAGDTAGGSYEAPRLPWGDPDLQSIWTSSGETPMERPEEYVGRETLTDEEVAAIRGDIEARNERLLNADAQRTQAGGNIGAYNNFWMDRGARTNRTSMIVDPPDGRFPPLTPRGQIAAVSQPRGDNVPADRHIWERCVTRGGMPNAMFPRSYNNNMQLFQTPDHVVMLLEQVHEVRVVPLGDGAAVSSRIGQWNGPRARPLGRRHAGSRHHESRSARERAAALVDLQLARRLRRGHDAHRALHAYRPQQSGVRDRSA